MNIRYTVCYGMGSKLASLRVWLLALSLAGCAGNAVLPSAHTWAPQSPWPIEDIRLLPQPVGKSGGDRVMVSEQAGLLLLNPQGAAVAQLPGSFERLDVRVQQEQQEQVQVATYDRDRQQVMLVTYRAAENQWQAPRWIPAQAFAVEGLCLYQREQLTFVFVLGTEGQGSQLLVADANGWLETPRSVRPIAVPPGAEHCQVDDRGQWLYISEPHTGVWRYPANEEVEVQRQPVAMRAPFGQLSQGADALALSSEGMLLLDAAAGNLYRITGQDAEHWQVQQSWPLQAQVAMAEPQQVSLREEANTWLLLLLDDAQQAWQLRLPKPTAPSSQQTARAGNPVIPVLQPSAQTAPVQQRGDAADDPAIWVHATDPAQSRVVGTNKQRGLLVYDLAGNLVQSLPVGRLNNVDLRYGDGFDVAVASNRDLNTVSVFRIEHGSGHFTHVGEMPTNLTAIYGICLYQPAANEWQVLANDKDGTFQQYRLAIVDQQVQGELLRQFALDSQPEGCVVDDARHALFVGEEDTGVWRLDARPQQAEPGPLQKTPVLMVGEVLKADVEGLALYQGDRSYLVISSQGNDSYVVLDSEPPYALQGVFRIGLNAALGIDGASETDGLEVTAANLGAPYEDGLLVVQDGRKRMPDGNQNFKLVPWSAVKAGLQLAP